MATLEELTPGSSVLGLIPQGAATIAAVQWIGENALDITYKDSRGNPGTRLLYREEESALTLEKPSLPYSFDAEGGEFRLAAEAWRIHYAHLFDPFLAVHTSDIDPLPHQISAVYQELLGRLPLRYILADDPGAGKTIMTGLFIKELIARGDLKRCLIVSPGSLAEQWQDELFRKFHLRFEVLTHERLENSPSGNAFSEVNFAIARLDKLARSDTLQEKLRTVDYDLIVCDEAHKMSATVWSGEVKPTRRWQLGRLLSGITRHFLLLTATPHNGKEEDFQLFLSLVDEDRFGGASRTSAQSVDVSDIMRRMVKEELLTFEGKKLFPERHAATVDYSLSPLEAELYQAVTEYVENEFNRADNLNSERRTTVGFALTVLQRRLASSPEAIYQSLRRRRERLEIRLAEERLGRRAQMEEQEKTALSLADSDFDEDDLPSQEREETESALADRASASSTVEELQAEIATLKTLEGMAERVRASGKDRKWEELSALLQDKECMFDADGSREKLIIFTEHRDTLRYLAGKIRSLLGSEEAVALIDGSMLRDERRKVEERFRQDTGVRILIATDAAGEGLNLQRAHLMVNYDLPWNPNRLEQRFGRIHRIGQTKACWLWNLVAAETREGKVFKRLFEKLEQERESLGGKVFDILGKVTFNNRPLRELLIEAVRHGSDPAVESRLHADINGAFSRKAILALLQEHALTQDMMDAGAVAAIRENMERMEARRLQPYFIEAFFKEAFRKLGGRMAPREKGRWEVTFVPHILRSRSALINSAGPVLKSYERICFEKRLRELPGAVPASLLCPSHPLLDTVIDILRERSGNILKRGAVLVDENALSPSPRLLLFIEHAIQDGTPVPGGGRRIISRRIHFVEIECSGAAKNAGFAPYLDYRPATEEEAETARTLAADHGWLNEKASALALNHAVLHLIPAHLEEVRSRKKALVEKTRKAVKERLTAEIQYWDYRAADLKQREQAGKKNAALNSQRAERRAEELEQRLKRRIEELAAEENISALPPVVIGAALIVPATHACTPGSPFCQEAEPRKKVEEAAMRAVMEAERAQGFTPRDVSAENCGYDIESSVPCAMEQGLPSLRFIEVKGRSAGASNVIVTRNEILTALNMPEQFILALVEVNGEHTRTTYLKRPFKNRPDFSSEAGIFNLSALMEQAEIIYQGVSHGTA